jgi:uncharacterized protein with von Willebrand factor type A (vWA) domain
MITRQTSLSKNIVHFCRFLRQKGFAVSVEEEALALQALQFIDYTSNRVFLSALRAVFCRSKEQLDEFDNLFYSYWREIGKAVDAKKKDEKNKAKPKPHGATHKSLKTWLHGHRNDETEETATYCVQEHLSQKDFSAVPEDEVQELMQTIKALSKRLAVRANRRYESSHKIALPDLRRTLRKNMRCGGELIDIVHRKPKRNRIKLVLLCDVSRSMELYSVFLLQFMYAFQQAYRRIETFVFSTSLKRVTPLLQQKNFREALHLLGSEKSDWASGTRIGESLEVFIKQYAKNMIDSKTIVMILSDGWDTGDPGPLKKSMQCLHNKSKKIIWLNPLAGYPGFQPDVVGMKTAMAYVDVFAPVHNAESFRKLGRLL